VDNAKGVFAKGIEPGYQYLSYVFSSLSGVKSNVDVFAFISAVVLLMLIQIALRGTLNSTDRLYVISILTLYVVTYQLAYNFRTGIASLMFILAFFSFHRLPRIALLLGTPLVHIQTLPASLMVAFQKLGWFQRALLGGVLAILLVTFFSYFYRFVFSQGVGYLSKYAGSIRLASVPYFAVYVFVLAVRPSWNPPGIRALIFFGLAVNVLFFFNSHIAARMTRPIEPVLMVAFFFALTRVKPRLYREVRLFIAMLPGLAFWVLEFAGAAQ
jgi:hypothetical protein